MGLRQFEIKSQGSLAELARINFGEALAMKVGFLLFTGRLWITFGCFLLGMYAGRIRLFVDTEQNRRRMWVLLTVGGAIALVSTAYTLLVAGIADGTGFARHCLHRGRAAGDPVRVLPGGGHAAFLAPAGAWAAGRAGADGQDGTDHVSHADGLRRHPLLRHRLWSHGPARIRCRGRMRNRVFHRAGIHGARLAGALLAGSGGVAVAFADLFPACSPWCADLLRPPWR